MGRLIIILPSDSGFHPSIELGEARGGRSVCWFVNFFFLFSLLLVIMYFTFPLAHVLISGTLFFSFVWD